MASHQLLRASTSIFRNTATAAFKLLKNPALSRRASTTTSPIQTDALNALNPAQNNSITKITTLSNGIRVTSENTPGHFSAIGVYLDAGSRYETPRTMGVSHLVDRLAFKGTKNRTIEQMQTELESLGGNIMSASSRETIMYQSAIFYQDLPRLLDILADVIRNPLITQEEVIEQQQTAIYELSEIWQKPDMILPELLHTVAYKDNTLGNPMLCPESKLAEMTPELIKEYIATWYRPERIVVAAAGAPHGEIVALTEKFFGDMPKSPDFNAHTFKSSVLGVLNPTKHTSKPSLYKTITTAATSFLSQGSTLQPVPISHGGQKSHYTGGTLYLEQPTLPHTHVYVALEGLPIHDPDIYALATLQILLGGGGSFSAGGPGKDSGLFGIFASCRPEYNHAVADVIAQQFDHVASPGRYGVTEEELNRAKNQLMSSLLMNLESRMVQLEDLGRQVQVHGFKVPVEVMCQKIREVTLEDLLRVAQRVVRGQVVNEGKGTGLPTIVAQGQLKNLQDVKKVCERYDIGKSTKLKWLR
ncbi:8805_t:CDS:2 [Ambispora gerdemannii]|uniref:Alpha-MPP n=1 Tax=Ambispora gerdemannii TaxID=144530 RepID=A0A9N9BT12_9GLOM|nr:8805_t:CDS:2 [Ambispora gerdemannii]